MCDGGQDDREEVARDHRSAERPEERDARVGVGRLGEEVPRGQDDRDELHVVDEAVERHRHQGRRRGASAQEVGHSRAELAGRPPQRLAQGRGPFHPVGSEFAGGEEEGGQGRPQVQEGRGHER